MIQKEGRKAITITITSIIDLSDSLLCAAARKYIKTL